MSMYSVLKAGALATAILVPAVHAVDAQASEHVAVPLGAVGLGSLAVGDE